MSFQPGWHSHPLRRGSPAVRLSDVADPGYKFLQSLLGDPALLANASDLVRLTKALGESPVDPAELAYFKGAYGKEQNSIDVVFAHRTRIKHSNGRTVEYRSGERASLPESLAGPMYSVGSLDVPDEAVREARGFTRRLSPEGREVRFCRAGVMSAV